MKIDFFSVVPRCIRTVQVLKTPYINPFNAD